MISSVGEKFGGPRTQLAVMIFPDDLMGICTQTCGSLRGGRWYLFGWFWTGSQDGMRLCSDEFGVVGDCTLLRVSMDGRRVMWKSAGV